MWERKNFLNLMFTFSHVILDDADDDVFKSVAYMANVQWPVSFTTFMDTVNSFQNQDDQSTNVEFHFYCH